MDRENAGGREAEGVDPEDEAELTNEEGGGAVRGGVG